MWTSTCCNIWTSMGVTYERICEQVWGATYEQVAMGCNIWKYTLYIWIRYNTYMLTLCHPPQCRMVSSWPCPVPFFFSLYSPFGTYSFSLVGRLILVGFLLLVDSRSSRQSSRQSSWRFLVVLLVVFLVVLLAVFVFFFVVLSSLTLTNSTRHTLVEYLYDITYGLT